MPAVHHMHSSFSPEFEAALQKADFIFGQQIADSFPVEQVRTSRLRDLYAKKLVVWPNLHFYGYGPDVDVLRDAEYKNFSGPLLDYHSDKILFGFASGWSVTATAELLKSVTAFDSLYAASYADSIKELQRRERDCDITASDLIEEHYRSKRLFYIMNHPSAFLVKLLADRFLSVLDLRKNQDVPDYYFSESELASVIHPTNLFMRENHKIDFKESNVFKGRRMISVSNNMKQAPSPTVAFYEPTALVETFFNFYEHHRDRVVSHGRTRRIVDRARSLM